MIIEDEELRQLYKVSSEEHLQNLEAGILHLEQHPEDGEKLQEVLREAHTLKGDSRMLGVKDVESLAHQIEQVVGKLKEDSTALQGGMGDRLYYGLDAMGKIVQEAVTGEPSGIQGYKVLAVLMGANIPESPTFQAEPQPEQTTEVAEAAPEPKTEREEPIELEEAASAMEVSLPEPESKPQPEEPPAPPEVPSAPEVSLPEPEPVVQEPQEPVKPISVSPRPPVPASPSPPPVPQQTASKQEAPIVRSNYRIESVRVATQNLDDLMTQTGELTVSKIRMAHHINTMNDMVSLWEEWNRQTYGNLGFEQSLDKLQSLKQRHEEYLEEMGKLLNQLRSRASEDVARLEAIANQLDSGIRTLRLLPLSTIFNRFPRLVRDLAKQQGKQVNLILEGAETKADKRILEEMKDPLMHMIRNSIDHGIETPDERIAQGKPAQATIHLRGSQIGNSIIIELEDDGQGLNLDHIKYTTKEKGLRRPEELEAMTDQQIQSLIFAPGFSTRQFVTEVSGRGVGLDVVRTNVEHLKGNIHVESTPGKGCKFTIQLSTSLATASVLLVSVQDSTYAIPVEFVKTTLLIPEHQIFAIEGRDTYAMGDRPISIARLEEILELSSSSESESESYIPKTRELLPCLILQVGPELLGVIVDELLDQQDIILKPQSRLLQRVRNISGATILGTGEVCMVLNPQDLIKSVQKRNLQRKIQSSQVVKQKEEHRKSAVLLLAEDSIATRTQEKRILESAGYEVVTAVDGLDAYNKLRGRHFDGVISDVQMPNLDGLSLAAKIREHKEYADLPIILVTSLASDEDKHRGAEAGASAYLTKGGFSQELLLETVRRLV
ncbi:MAG: hybrid sensor histidine kinase/response regulator [Roseofilum sp. Belize BBD 4]|uniref:hybrid sensor histidine kinase/response regulator n=1 Tax=Roseofilum sp. Belize BBD 4 TaxID=2821500 RepID=UPI001B032A3A|nr:hybrid sensor histidine kinase/response regulator [Roseofilum sp. Belize BBD 4]MBP0034006.1 hybrid sensor histidine kinase/response regulator [Roseofilum sp. Belize BBD 4]